METAADPTNVAPAKPAAPVAPAAPAPVNDQAAKIDQIISDWTTGHIFNSPLSRNSEAYNHLLTALPHLKSALLKGV
jgi:hypothetical protein